MSRGNYGSVGRRSNSAVWQWVIIGMVVGFGCSIILLLGGLAAGLVSLDGQAAANQPTQTPYIITATPEPVTPTLTPTEALVEPTDVQLEVLAPTASPTLDPTLMTAEPTATPTTLPEVGATTDSGPIGAASAGGSLLSEQLLALASPVEDIAGGTFQMGTTAAEVIAAVNQCVEGYGGVAGACSAAMGEDSSPPHSVSVSPFRMEIYEVSYAQYLTFMNELGPGSHRNGCDGQPCMQTQNESETSNVTFDSANYSVPSVINDFPMVNVTWYGAKAYCEAIGRRLPTEAEWERAARGDTGFVYPWGDTWDATRASTNRPDGGGEPQKVAVSAFPTGASPFGILNMAGNVAEWTSDWYDARFYSRPEAAGLDPRGPVSGTEKVVRGGSWDAVPFFARTAHRQSRQPLDPTAWIGFRCVEDINAVAPVNAPIGADVAPSLSTPDPALLGVPGAADEETTANSAPTLPPAPTRAVEATQSGPAPTLAPGG